MPWSALMPFHAANSRLPNTASDGPFEVPTPWMFRCGAQLRFCACAPPRHNGDRHSTRTANSAALDGNFAKRTGAVKLLRTAFMIDLPWLQVSGPGETVQPEVDLECEASHRGK